MTQPSDPGNTPIEVPEGFTPGTGNNAPGPEGTPPVNTSVEPVVTPPAVVPDVPYKEQLEAFPESLRPTAAKIFQEWDANVNKRFEALHSQLEPWKQVTESYDPETVNQALALAQYMENDPKALYEALAEAYNLGGQGQPNQQQPPGAVSPEGTPVLDPDNPLTAELAQLREQLGMVAQAVVTKNQQDEMVQANAQLDSIMAGLKEKHGAFDETYVYTLIANNVDPEAAVQQYKTALDGALAQRQAPNAPVVVGDGGGQPAEPFDPSKMDSKQTRAHVASMLAAAAAQGD